MSKHIHSLLPSYRYEDIQRILSYIKQGNFCQVIGLPGVGREQLFDQLVSNKALRQKHLGTNEASFHFIYLTMAEVKGRPHSDVLKLMLLSVLDSLRERGNLDEYVGKAIKESFALQDEVAFGHGLKRCVEYLTHEKGLTIVYLFDQFDEYIRTVENAFFALLEVLHEKSHGKFAGVFALYRPLEEIMEAGMPLEAYRLLSGHEVYLSLSDETSLLYEKTAIEEKAGVKIQQSVFEHILSLTGGHLKMTRVSLEEVVRNDRSQSSEDLKNILLESRAVRSISYHIWGVLRPAEQGVLKALVTQVHADVPEFFKKIQLITNDSITIPLFEEFVRYRVEHHLDDKLAYDPQTKDIFKGDMRITEQFTGLEYSLLSYLLLRQGELIERENVISHVWKDVKTTSGVTDQAVDQLILRVRKKVEDDPNNPTHIITVKGRGVTFRP